MRSSSTTLFRLDCRGVTRERRLGAAALALHRYDAPRGRRLGAFLDALPRAETRIDGHVVRSICRDARGCSPAAAPQRPVAARSIALPFQSLLHAAEIHQKVAEVVAEAVARPFAGKALPVLPLCVPRAVQAELALEVPVCGT